MPRSHIQIKALSDLWDLIVRYRWRLVVPAFITTLAMLSLCLFLPRKYRAEAMFERRTDMVLLEIMMRGAPRSFQDPRQSLIEEVAGPPAIDEMLAQLEPQFQRQAMARNGFYDRSALRTNLRRRLVVSYDIATNELDRVRLSFVGSDPQISAEVVNSLVRNYIERTRAQMESRLKQSAAFFQAEVQRNHQLIEELENEQLNFEIEHAILLPDTPQNIQTELTQLETNLKELRQKREAAQLRVKALADSLAQTPDTQPSLTRSKNPELLRLEAKLRELESQLANYLGVLKMTDRHPDLAALRAQITLLKEEIVNTPVDVVSATQINTNPIHADLQVMLTSARAEFDALEHQCRQTDEQLEQLKAQASKMFPVRSNYRRISRRVDEVRRQMTFWEDNLRRVQMTLAAESGNRGIRLDFIQPASPSSKPVSPDLKQVLMGSLAMGLLVGVVSLVSAMRTDETFRNGEQMASAVGLPLFGSVSEIISRQQQRLRTLRHVILYPTGAAVMVAVLAILVSVLYVSLETAQAHPAVPMASATSIPPTGSSPLIEPPAPATPDGTEPVGEP